MMSRALIVLAAAALLSAQSAAAQGLYKSVMPDGRVIYGDKPAPGAARVEPLDFGPAPPPADSGSAAERRQQLLERSRQVDERLREREAARRQAEETVTRARQLLADAEKARELGRTPLPGEMVANVGGGVRPSAMYVERQQALEDQVVVARERLEASERELSLLR